MDGPRKIPQAQRLEVLIKWNTEKLNRTKSSDYADKGIVMLRAGGLVLQTNKIAFLDFSPAGFVGRG